MATTTISDIESHYDIGDEFYALWLDETLTYSAALWKGISPDEPEDLALKRAQQAKFTHHLNLAKAPAERTGTAGFRLLDVGCGWGGLMNFAVATGRVTEATGLTLSHAQRDHIAADHEPGVQVALESWEDHHIVERYDGIISVGAFEHFVTAQTPANERVRAYASYFECCHSLLRPGASMSLQTIAYDGVVGQIGPVGAFITGEIFPGSTLPRLAEITRACDPYFAVRTLSSDAEDYARTLAIWSARLGRAREAAKALVGPDVVRRYQVYMRACETIFRRGGATLYRIGLERRDAPLALQI